MDTIDIVRKRMFGELRLNHIPDVPTILEHKWDFIFIKRMLDGFPSSFEILRFLSYMKNRIIMGAFRYDSMRQDENFVEYDYMGSIIYRSHLYKKQGNDEILVDIANLCMREFNVGVHPLRYYHDNMMIPYCVSGALDNMIRLGYLYKRTGNTACLFYISQFCLCEYLNGEHPKKHFSGVDNTHIHVGSSK